MPGRDPDTDPNLFEPFDPSAVARSDLLTTKQATAMFGISQSWLYDRMWPKGPLHRIEISGDREKYLVRSEIASLRKPRVTGRSDVVPPPPA